METIVFVIIQQNFTTLGITYKFSSFSWGLFNQVACLDQSHEGKIIRWIINSETFSFLRQVLMCSIYYQGYW